MEDKYREMEGVFIVTGDFNSKAVEWSMTTAHSRERRVLKMAARLGLSVLNVGITPTFILPAFGRTIPDITLSYVRLGRLESD